MTRLLTIWRSWSVGQRTLAVGAAALALGGIGVAAYLVLKRPGDVSNPNATFIGHEKKQKAVETVNWPVYGFDDERTRYLPSKEVKPPYHSSEWSFQAGRLLEFSPILVDGALYLIDKEGLFYAFDAASGKILWKRDIGSLNASSPAHADGRLFAATLSPGQVVSLRPKDGKVLWRHPLPGRSETSPVVFGDKVIVGCENGDVLALDVDTGKVEWTVSTEGAVKGGVALHEGAVFFGNYAGELYAVDAASGSVKWQTGTQGSSFGLAGRIYSTPAVAFGRVYVGSIDGRVYSFEEATGDLAWSHSTGAEVYPGPAVADTPGAPPTVFVGSADQHFYALDAKDGSERWSDHVGGLVIGSPSVIGRVAYVGVIGPKNGTYGYDTGTGEQVFESDLGEYNPAISDGHRLYLTGYSEVRAFLPDAEKGGGDKGGGGDNGGGEKGRGGNDRGRG